MIERMMEKMDKQISVYTKDEKDLIKRLEEFYSQFNSKLKQGEEVSMLEYYDKLKFGQTIEINSDFYLANIKGGEGNRTEIYVNNPNKLIGYLDENGNVEFVDDFLNQLQLSLTIEDLKDINLENLKAKINELEPQEVEEDLNELKDTQPEEDDKSKGQKEEENKKPEAQVEEDLRAKNGEKDLQISYYREIKDDQLTKAFPDKFKGAESFGIAYSKSLNRFICVKSIGGKFEQVDGIEPSKPTRRSIISINENGDRIERKSPHALLKTDNDRKELSITIGQYGYVEAGIVDRLPCNERVETQVREDGQGEEGRTEYEIRKQLNRGGTEVVHELAHNYNENEENLGIETQNLEAIDGDEEIKLQNGEITTLAKEAEKAKVSLEEFINILKETEGTTIDEKIESAHLEVERQSGAPDRSEYRR